ncbi:filament integrity protein FraC [Kamptonema sp. UHCC 0994]|uniref:filament integrity protein FraC n=1 Tax=Kamptonema sp. UHCC 0994 TaxID=3031329 RepID=UPI0023B88A9E|nr:filament integrity protein FraC [Kamptonema sp. UHCC 0994]MDF0551487.1 hypothetical protein [Kamptonema sp. UHCC 0994]
MRAVLSQILILWLAIAIESWFFQKFLILNPKTSVEYAAVINLFSTCIGWLIFFIWESFLSKNELELLMGYILLGQWNPISVLLIVGAFLIYTISFLGKWKGLEILQLLLQVNQKKLAVSAPKKSSTLGHRHKKFAQVFTQAGVVLIAHTCSHCAILLVLYLESK